MEIPPPQGSRRRPSRLVLIGAGAVVILVGFALYLFLHRGEESTDDAAFDAHVVVVSPKVGGYVHALYVDDNTRVTAGQVLLEIDPTDYRIRRDRALAFLQAAQAGHVASSNTLATTRVSAPSNIDAARAQVDAAQANWVKAASELKRLQHLSDEARSRQQLEAAIAAERTAHSNWTDARAKLRSAQTAPRAIAAAKSNAEQLAAQANQARADLAQAEKDLADTRLVAPMDGRVIKRGVERGDYVQPGQALAELVGGDVWVLANFKETQLTHMKPGDRAILRVDAYPDARIEGKVDSIQSGTGARFSAFPPENATGNFVKIVQRVPVKIVLTSRPDTSLILGPGMSVEPTVFTR